MSAAAHDWLARIRALPLPPRLRIMNVCGGQERVVSQAGLRGVLPAQISLIPGPGCPVCVCPEQDIFHAIQLALRESVTLVSFGDMLRVPVNVAKGGSRTLEEARAAGADVRPIASPRQALAVARSAPERPVVFFAAGFETTMAPVAAMIAEGLPDNLFVLISGRLTWPAVATLLDSAEAGFDALIAPGHVAAVMGPEQWAFIPQRHRLPTAVAGFTAESLLAAIYHCAQAHIRGEAALANCYAEIVRPGGNHTAQHLLDQVLAIVDAPWRGVGRLANSGYRLRERYAAHDARHRWPLDDDTRRHAGEMPPGCACGDVILGRIAPDRCPLYGKACTPHHPVGPCMVSDEGACRIWWQGG